MVVCFCGKFWTDPNLRRCVRSATVQPVMNSLGNGGRFLPMPYCTRGASVGAATLPIGAPERSRLRKVPVASRMPCQTKQSRSRRLFQLASFLVVCTPCRVSLPRRPCSARRAGMRRRLCRRSLPIGCASSASRLAASRDIRRDAAAAEAVEGPNDADLAERKIKLKQVFLQIGAFRNFGNLGP